MSNQSVKIANGTSWGAAFQQSGVTPHFLGTWQGVPPVPYGATNTPVVMPPAGGGRMK